MRTSASSADLKHFQLTLLLYQFRFMNRNSSKNCVFHSSVLEMVLIFTHCLLTIRDNLNWGNLTPSAGTWKPVYLLRCEIHPKYSHTDFSLRSRLKVPKICPAEKTVSSCSYHTATWYEFSLWFILLYTHTHTHTHTHKRFTNATCVNWQLNMTQVKIKKSHKREWHNKYNRHDTRVKECSTIQFPMVKQ